MFKKLLSNLPFNPSLIGKVSFYARRMHREASIRRLGLILVILSFFVQFFAVLSPPEPTLAASDNDIIRGGFSSREQAFQLCQANDRNFANILEYHRISCGILEHAEVITIKSTDHNKQFDSMGRVPQGPTILSTGKSTDEYAVNIQGGPYYMRNLWAWDTGASSSYKVLKMTNPDGQVIMVMFDCGNIITIGRYTPPPPPPPPTQDVCPTINGVQTDRSQCPDDVCPTINGVQTDRSQCPDDVCPTINGVQTNRSQCPDDVCPTINGVQTDRSQCPDDVCPTINGVQTDRSQCPDDVCPTINGVQTNRSQCPDDVCPTISGVQTNRSLCPDDVCPNKEGVQTRTSDCDICPEISGTQTNQTECKPCDQSTNDEDVTICLSQHKTARNSSQNISNANGTTARAGDTIVYTLTVKNSGKIDAKGYIIEENLADILEYADITDNGGGTLDASSKIMRWPAQDVKKNSSISKKLTIKIKDPIPATPEVCPNTSTGGRCARSSSFDMTITNVFGDTVSITLPPSVPKITEQVTKTLPNTGPGASLAISFTITTIVAYFFARSRLMAKELDIVRVDFGSTGGI